MIQIEVFDGKRYLFTIMPSDDPEVVLNEEAKRYPRLKTVAVVDGKRTRPMLVETCEYDDFEEEDEDDA